VSRAPRRPLARLPIRLRLTLGFALVMAAVLALAGLAAKLTFTADLDRSVRDSLMAHTDAVAALVLASSPTLATDPDRLAEPGGSVAQVLDSSGRVLAATGPTRRPLLDAGELARARRGVVWLDRGEVAGLGELGDPMRLLASPVAVTGMPGGRVVVVVGASLEGHDQALDTLRRGLLVGGPILLMLAALAGYGLAAAALRPVEVMRRRAAAISARQPSQRLAVPAARDELARLGVTLNELLDRVEGAIARERGFVADASHELRTPLARLKTELELALRRPRTLGELERALGSAAEETDRLVRLAEDLLLLARADQASLPLRLVEVDVAELLTRVGDRFAVQAHHAGRPLRVEAPDSLAVLADTARLEQATSMLVDNALCHGRGLVRLFAVADDTGATLELHVTDEGEGFPAPLLGRVFERFVCGERARGGGAGLGLAIARAVAEAHAGSAHAANRAPYGADVWLALPRPQRRLGSQE